jgi:serine/threonine protein kinase
VPLTNKPTTDGTEALRRLLVQALADRYRIEGTIGAGGMATVFRAADRRHDRQVAVKVLAPDLAARIGPARFESEIRVTANLSHPHILPLFDSGVADGLLYYVMPYVEDGSLRDRIRGGERLPIDEVVRLTHAIASALDYAHARGVVHRDIKPENILLAGDASYLADFGIALVDTEDRLTAPGASIGTPAYMSPEQVEAKRQLDGRSDEYALACVAYEMLAGEPPFPGQGITAALGHLLDRVLSVRDLREDLPAEADAVLQRALAKDRDDRYPLASAFARALAAACCCHAGPPPPPQVRTPPWGRSAARTGWRLEQEIRFCEAPDGVRIAYAESGEGPPLVKAANWMSHLEFDAESPVWRHWWRALSSRFRLFRYDERACGLSDWDVEDISFDAWLSDLEAVVDAAGLDRFSLLGISKGGAIATAYAARHPDRVERLIIHGGFARGRDFREQSSGDRERIQLELDMVRLGWGGRNPAFRQAFTTMFFPGADPEQTAWFNELQRISASPENATRILAATREINVTDAAARVRCPTLALHSRDDVRVPFGEGRFLASRIPGARFVPLDSPNHLPLEPEAAWAQCLLELDRFCGFAPRREGSR